MRVPIARPCTGPEEAEAAARVVRSGWLSQGTEVAGLEQDLADRLQAGHVVATSSGTTALELALRAVGVGPGDEVVTVSHSFVATANSVLAVGAVPVFVDVEDDTLGMDPSHVEPALGSRTRAILCVHQLGIPCDLHALAALADRRGLPLLEDAACALGSRLDGRPLGRPAGVAACLSFHPRKVVTTGEGGAVVTADGELAARVRRERQHGAGPDGSFDEPGRNARLSDLHAAVGRVQLRRLDGFLRERCGLADRLSALLQEHPVLAPPPPPRPGAEWNWQSYPARLRPGHHAADVLARLRGLGVDARPGVANAHELPAYRGRGTWRAGPLGLAASERAHRQTVLLPLFHGMTVGSPGTELEFAL